MLHIFGILGILHITYKLYETYKEAQIAQEKKRIEIENKPKFKIGETVLCGEVLGLVKKYNDKGKYEVEWMCERHGFIPVTDDAKTIMHMIRFLRKDQYESHEIENLVDEYKNFKNTRKD